MLGVVTLDRAAGAQALVERPPGEQQGREAAHVLERRGRAAGGEGEARVAVLVHHALGPGRVHLLRDDIQGLIPAYLHPARVLVPALFRVGALHGPFDAVGVIQLLHQPERFDTDLAVGGVFALQVEIGLDLGGNAVNGFHGQQVGAIHALVAIGGNSFNFRFNFGVHPSFPLFIYMDERDRRLKV